MDSGSDSHLEMRDLMAPLNEDNDDDTDNDGDDDADADDDDDNPSDGYCHRQCLRNNRKKDSRKLNDPISQSYLQNDLDETNIQEQLFSALNQIEDELDEHTYKEIVPLSIRIQLENQIFGWTHLYSIFFGHIFYTMSAYFVTFWLLSYLGLKHMQIITNGDESEHGNADAAHNDHQQSSHTLQGCAWDCFVEKIFYDGKSEASGADAIHQYIPIMGVPPLAFILLRIIFSLSSALSAFRTVRRRSMVWLHSSTSKRMRNTLRETDRTTLLGRIRSGMAKKKHVWLTRRKERKIRKASSRFERRHQRRKRRRRKCPNSNPNEKHLFQGGFYDKTKESNRPTPRIAKFGLQDRTQLDSSSNDCEDSASSSSRSRHKTLRKRRFTKSKSLGYSLDPGDFLKTFQNYEGHTERGYSTSTRFSGHTMPASVMQSVLQDQIRFKHGLLQNVSYAHGGYFGAAPFMLANPHWINILRRLMPDVYVEISQRVIHAPIPKLIHWAENNPVMAAYGTAHDLEYCETVPTVSFIALSSGCGFDIYHGS